MFVPGTYSWAAIGAATKATSAIAMGADSFSEEATPKVGVTPEVTQATGATPAAALKTGGHVRNNHTRNRCPFSY